MNMSGAGKVITIRRHGILTPYQAIILIEPYSPKRLLEQFWKRLPLNEEEEYWDWKMINQSINHTQETPFLPALAHPLPNQFASLLSIIVSIP